MAGDYRVDEPEGTEQIALIEDFYLHEDFRKVQKMNNDIALVKLKGNGFSITPDVQPICLPDSDTPYHSDMNCTISGFGSTKTGKACRCPKSAVMYNGLIVLASSLLTCITCWLDTAPIT